MHCALLTLNLQLYMIPQQQAKKTHKPKRDCNKRKWVKYPRHSPSALAITHLWGGTLR